MTINHIFAYLIWVLDVLSYESVDMYFLKYTLRNKWREIGGQDCPLGVGRKQLLPIFIFLIPEAFVRVIWKDECYYILESYLFLVLHSLLQDHPDDCSLPSCIFQTDILYI